MTAFELPHAAATEALGRRLAKSLGTGAVVSLSGDLGTGKTTLARALIQALGYRGAVVSPTYTLVEPYPVTGGGTLYHLDLYRLSSPEELEYLGIRDRDPKNDWLVVEWPAKGAGFLPPADVEVRLSHAGDRRHVRLLSGSDHGRDALDRVLEDSGYF